MPVGTLEEFMNTSFKDFTNDGKCPKGCGQCCTNLLPCTPKELDDLAEYAKKNGIKMHSTCVISNSIYDMSCPFRNEITKRCEVYAIRPSICREYMCDANARHEYSKSAFKMILRKDCTHILLREEMQKRGVK